MTGQYSKYKSYIDERVQCYPFINEMISFYKGLIDIWDNAIPDDLVPLLSFERMDDGLYVIDDERTDRIDLGNSVDTARWIFNLMRLHKMKDADDYIDSSSREIADFIRKGIRGKDKFRNVILKWILKPSFYSLFSSPDETGFKKTMERKGLSWSSAQCPVCNSPAGMAIVETVDEPKRYLSCCFCNYVWEFQADVCPCCGNRNRDKIGLIVPEAGCDYGTRAVSCEQCKRYLKTIFIKCREDGRSALELDADIEDVITLPLDIMANKRGYTPLCEK